MLLDTITSNTVYGDVSQLLHPAAGALNIAIHCRGGGLHGPTSSHCVGTAPFDEPYGYRGGFANTALLKQVALPPLKQAPQQTVLRVPVVEPAQWCVTAGPLATCCR
jgi:hypothetical protein